jgi:hypothetical protein
VRLYRLQALREARDPRNRNGVQKASEEIARGPSKQAGQALQGRNASIANLQSDAMNFYHKTGEQQLGMRGGEKRANGS